MSVLVKGFKIPIADEPKTFITRFNDDSTAVMVALGYPQKRYSLVEVPPHGRLIDADAFEKENAYFWDRDFINPKYEDTLADLVNTAPTIIEAEDGE